jgi:hypothetical protein
MSFVFLCRVVKKEKCLPLKILKSIFGGFHFNNGRVTDIKQLTTVYPFSNVASVACL